MLTVNAVKKERVILVGVGRDYNADVRCNGYNPFEELSLLADTAGAEVVGTVTQMRPDIAPTYYIGKGKAEELKNEVENADADMVIFDNDLSPAQLSNLEKYLEKKVIDRSGLILDIFALRAQTSEAKTQVELAQLKYLLTRLTRQWTHLSRQQGGIGTRGPGETQLEVDRRSIRNRISHLENMLKKIERRRSTSRHKRQDCFKAALVGYTNAGKSTLLNELSGAGAAVENKLFKTLDSLTRFVRFESSPDILLSDTVGFIRDLPHDLIASFKSTLDEVREADILLHVIDITNPEWEKQITVVTKVLSELGASETDIIMVFNKIDRLEYPRLMESLNGRYPRSVFVSSLTGEGIDGLKSALVQSALRSRVTLTSTFASGDSERLSQIYRNAVILATRADGDTIELTFTLPVKIATKLGLTGQKGT